MSLNQIQDKKIDPYEISWKAIREDFVLSGDSSNQQQYLELNLSEMEILELYYNDKLIFSAAIEGRTVVMRSRAVTRKFPKLKADYYVRMVAFLKKNEDSNLNTKFSVDLGNNKTQDYEFDVNQSDIFYIYPDKTMTMANTFYPELHKSAVALISSELDNLNKKTLKQKQ